MRSLKLPRNLNIEPTNRCNLACPVCPLSSSHTRERGFMTLETLGALLRGCRGHVSSVSLYLHGEPFLNPNLPEMVTMIQAAGIETAVSTNGLAVRTSDWEKVLDAGPQGIRFSMDLISREGYARFRGVDAYDAACERLGELVDINAKRGSRTRIAIRSIYDGESRNELLAFLNCWLKRPGVSQIEFTRPCPWPGTKDPEILAGHMVRDQRQPCGIAWSSTSVCWDGRVVPCSFDHNAEYVIGNIHEAPLSEIIDSEAARRFRGLHALGKRDSIALCADCLLPRFFLEDVTVRKALFNKASHAQVDDLLSRIEALMPRLSGTG